MSEQLTLDFDPHVPDPPGFDSELGEQLREEAIRRVEIHADDDVKDALLTIGRSIAKQRELFTTDAIRYVYERDVGTTIREPRVLGAIMRQLAKERVCLPTLDWRVSTWARNHRRPLRVWRSLIYQT